MKSLMIENSEISKMISDYNTWFQIHGDSHLSVGWNKPKSKERFEIFYREFSPLLLKRRMTVIDLGCGLAHFYQYLKEKNIDVNYIGVDINNRFIAYCKEKYPEQSFICASVENIAIHSDIIVASGLFNRRFSNSSDFINLIFNFAISNSKIAFAFNFLHANALRKYEHNYYAAVGDIESLFSRDKLAGFKVDANSVKGEFTFFGYK